MRLPLFINNEGFFFDDKKAYFLAFGHYFKALELAKRLHDESVSGQSYNNIGCLLCDINKRELAKPYFDSALIIYEHTKDYELVAHVISGAILSFKSGEKLQEKLEFAKKGIEYKLKTGNKRDLAAMYLNLGVAQYDLCQYDSALLTYSKVVELAQLTDVFDVEISAYLYLAITYKKVKQYEKALSYLLKANNLAGNAKLNWVSAKVVLEIRDLYLKTGRESEALKYNNEVEAANNFLKSLSEKENFNVDLGKFYAISSNYADSVLTIVQEGNTKDQSQESSTFFNWIIAIIALGVIALIWFLVRQKKHT